MTDGNLIFKTRTEQRIEAETGREIADVLTELYQGQGMTQAEIAARLRVSRTTVIDMMARHKIATIDRRAIASQAS